MSSGLSLLIPVERGWINPSPAQHQLIRNYLQTREGKAVQVKLSRPMSTRSKSANAYYWGVCLTLLAESTGHTTEEVHDAVKELFLPRQFIQLGSHEVEIAKSTTRLTTDEFEKYLTQLRAWAETELNITIPLPNE